MTALRVANCSGFYGDRLSAMREVLTDGEGLGSGDVITGDYLAELTMLILGKDTLRDPALGYARTFVKQVEDVLGEALERGVRIVSNAGGLNPAGLAERLREVARGLGLDPAVAHVDGDDLRTLSSEIGLGANALTANAYLGGFGIADALTRGADIVVTGRVTDASLVVGPAIAHHGWTETSYDALAGAVVAGHVIECGTQATGGNFSGFLDLPHRSRPLGFPIAEIAVDGSCVVTKHDGTGGAVTVDTVTAQLLYEVQGPHYLNPDVTTDLGSVTLAQVGPDRVGISGVRGGPPPSRLKVCVNELGGWRNSVEFVLTGLDLEAKADWTRQQLEAAWAARGARPETVVWTLTPQPTPDSATEEAASCRLRCQVLDSRPEVAGKGLTGPAVELGLASYPGFTLTAPPSPASPYGVYRAAYVDRGAVTHTVHHADGSTTTIADPVTLDDRPGESGSLRTPPRESASGPTRRVPLGTFVHARSGDKGGDANLGLWAASGAGHEQRAAWLLATVTPQWVQALLPETADLEVEVHPLPNLGGVNVLVRGLLGDGVAASTRWDPQAKALGEWARSRLVDIPEVLL